jgi:hypothetical protein
MKHLLPSLTIGLLAAILLLALGFLLPVQGDFEWLGRLAYGPGDYAFPYARQGGALGTGELLHHSFVLGFSLISWWCAFAAATYIFRKRT